MHYKELAVPGIQVGSSDGALGAEVSIRMRYWIKRATKADMPDYLGAQTDLDKIRKRGLASAPDVTEIGPALIVEILKERRIELCFEGVNFHTLFFINNLSLT